MFSVNDKQTQRLTSVTRNSHHLVTNKADGDVALSLPPLSISAPFLGYVIKLLEAIRKGKKWKQGLEVTESHSDLSNRRQGSYLLSSLNSTTFSMTFLSFPRP